MGFRQTVLVVLLSLAVSVSAAYFIMARENGNSANRIAKETRLEQVKHSGVIRCGYVPWAPFLAKDANTGHITGMFYDLAEEIGRQLKLKIEWTTEIVPGQMMADLTLNRYDMACMAFFEMPGRAREGDFTIPLFYSPIYLYVRQDDARFDDHYPLANNPQIKLATLDGEISSFLSTEDFPAATKVAVPQLSNMTDIYMMVATNKADAATEDPYSFANFNKTNPGLLRPAKGGPIRLIGMGMPLPANEPAFKAMLNTTLAYLHDSGFIERLLKKYEGSFKLIRVTKNYDEQ